MTLFDVSRWKAETHWSGLARLGTNPIVRRMYIWLFITPAAVKILDQTEIWLSNVHTDNSALDLRLPFSWVAFFSAALLFTIGSFLFNRFCPTIIKNYKNFAEFEFAKLPWNRIWEFNNDLSENGKKELYRELKIESDGSIEPFFKRDAFHFTDKKSGSSSKSPNDLFYRIYDVADKDFESARIVSSLVYGLGFFLFLFVVIQNIVFTISWLLN